jgi:mycoredoxin
MEGKKIRMYGTSWCPDCARARKFLDGKGVSFEWIDIEKDKAAAAYVEEVNKGNRSVPTIIFPDGSKLVEPSNTELDNKLATVKG